MKEVRVRAQTFMSSKKVSLPYQYYSVRCFTHLLPFSYIFGPVKVGLPHFNTSIMSERTLSKRGQESLPGGQLIENFFEVPMH